MQSFILFIMSFLIVGALNADNARDPEVDTANISFYDKGLLNDPLMQFESDALKTHLEQHLHQVREGSIGGYDSSGGSCGCN